VSEEEERAHRRGPHGSDMEERKRNGEKMQLKRESVLRNKMPRALGPTQSVKKVAAYGGRAGRLSRLGRSG
jgi:hypothetical protein